MHCNLYTLANVNKLIPFGAVFTFLLLFCLFFKKQLQALFVLQPLAFTSFIAARNWVLRVDANCSHSTAFCGRDLTTSTHNYIVTFVPPKAWHIAAGGVSAYTSELEYIWLQYLLFNL